MTKEEIAQEIADNCGSPYPEVHVPEIIAAMDAYTKQESINFSEWVYRGELREVYCYRGNGKWELLKPSTVRIPAEIITSKQLYELYLKDKNK